MNIFVLDLDPSLAAQYQCDKHVVKMVLESAQILSAVAILNGVEYPGIYGLTHQHHPSVRWAAATAGNCQWLVKHSLALCLEYTKRYKKQHKSQAVIEQLADLPSHLSGELTPFALAMPKQYKSDCPVQSYRAYYAGAKRDIASWCYTREPEWWPHKLQPTNAKSIVLRRKSK